MKTLSEPILKVLAATDAFPRVKAELWRRWYELLAKRYSQGDWTFMNYGFMDEAIEHLDLDARNSADRPFIGLYERVTRGIDLADKRVVEVGSGRGGGASYLARHKNPQLLLGLDFSDQAVLLAQKLHDAPCLRFRQGNALALPLEAASFDVVVNVESSHCYPSMPVFLSEVARVLKPGGAMGWCDMRPRTKWDALRAEFEAAGFAIEEDTDITPNVVRALDYIAPAKERDILGHVPTWLRASFADFAGMPGSRIYRLLQSREVRYGAIRARRV